jgi:hypothetical protein
LLSRSAFAGVIAKIDVENSRMWSASHLDEKTSRKLIPRIFDPSCVQITTLVGDGNPHINYFAQQVTPTVSGCDQGNTQCSTGASQTTSFGWSASIGGDAGWISGGFDVSEEVQNGVNEGCSTGPPNQNVCLWYQQAYVAYTVQTYWSSTLCGTDGASYIIWSPTNGNACGGGYYCVVNDCRSQGQGYWTMSGPAGSC